MNKTYCIFSANYFPYIGGVEKYTENLALALAAGGDKVVIVTSNVFNLPFIEELSAGVEIVRLPCIPLMNGRLPLPRKNAQYRELFKYVFDLPIDYVVINTRFYFHSFEGVRLAKGKGIRPLVIDHGSAHLTLGNKYADKVVALYEHVITRFLKKNDIAFYAVSEMSCRWLDHFGISSQGVLNNSIDAKGFREASSGRDFRSEYGIPKDSFVVSFTGRLVPEKGVLALTQAAEDLSGSKDIFFLVAGDGPLREAIASKRVENLILLGRLNSPDVAALLLDSDVFCLPTRSEGFSTSLLECAACGTTPIITHVGGVDELLGEEDLGCLIDEADHEAIKSAISFLNQDRNRCMIMGKELKKRVEREFSWFKTADKVRRACSLAND